MRENDKVIDTHNIISGTMFEPRVNYHFENFNTIAVWDGLLFEKQDGFLGTLGQ